MESLLDRDVELKLGIKIESNSYRRHVKEVTKTFIISNIQLIILSYLIYCGDSQCCNKLSLEGAEEDLDLPEFGFQKRGQKDM